MTSLNRQSTRPKIALFHEGKNARQTRKPVDIDGISRQFGAGKSALLNAWC